LARTFLVSHTPAEVRLEDRQRNEHEPCNRGHVASAAADGDGFREHTAYDNAESIAKYDFHPMTDGEMQNVATQLHRQPQSGKAFSANQWTSSRGQNAIAGIEYQGRASDPTSGYASWNGILAVLQSTTDVAVKA
jgi:hypothetical protein